MRRREFLSLAAASPLLLAEGSKTRYTICLSRDASPSEQRGARELQNYLEQMGGVRLPVVTDRDHPSGPLLLVGRSAALEQIDDTIPFDTLGNEGFALKTSGQHVIIAGGRQRGTMYGVSTFLEKLGCRWYAPDCTYVPKLGTLRVPALNEVQKPAFEYREVFITEAEGKDWAARNRANGNFSQLDESTGGKITFFPWSHSFYLLIPPEKYFSTHPEYFALVDGERRDFKSQLCLSNPEVLRIATETVLQWAAEHPEATLLSVSQNDADAPCECSNCRRIEEEEGAHSGLILRFVNSIAAEVARKYPNKLVTTLAYGYSLNPPLKVRPAPNVRIRLAMSGTCNGHPFERCPYNKFFMSILRSWSQITNQLYSWHYITDFHQVLAPYPNLDELSTDVALYRRHGVRGIFLQGAFMKGGGGELAELRSYLLAKLLWNPEQDAGAIMQEFLQAYYGPAAPIMNDYINLIHREVRLPPQGRGKSIYMYATVNLEPEVLAEAHGMFNRMEAVTEGPRFKEPARRVRKARLGIESVEMMNAKRFVLKDGEYGPADLEDFWAKYDRLTQKLHHFGITSVNEEVLLDIMDREYRQYVKNYRTVTIENGLIRVIAAPGFQGRVVSLTNKKNGQNAVRMSEPDTRFTALEVLGGLILLVHPEFYSRDVYPAEWSVESHDDALEVALQGVCPNGLQLKRRLSLPKNEPVLYTTTEVRNEGKEPVTVTLESRIQVNPGDRQHPTVDFLFFRRDGTLRRERILPPPDNGNNYGDEYFHGQERPAGKWGLSNSSRHLKLTNLFTDDQVVRCRLWWRGRDRNTVALSSWSPKRTLSPGQSLSFRTQYEAE